MDGRHRLAAAGDAVGLMMSTGYTQADLERLRTAMLTGVKEISVGGRRKVFHSLKEMSDLYDKISLELSPPTVSARRYPTAVRVVVDL